ncbi:MAG: hypothetical protein NTW86_05120 [Candidatus Sumerlaeota bacterium]|nr:hypothetical protein [Candidatus Sumerlaeota bacterium]
MKPIDPMELSALLDGELSPERADQVRRAIAQDELLRREYEELAALDADLRARAQAATFAPRVSFPEAAVVPNAAASFRPPMILGALAFMAARLALMAAPPALVTSVGIVALTLIVTWGLRRLLRAAAREQRRLAEESEIMTRGRLNAIGPSWDARRL